MEPLETPTKKPKIRGQLSRGVLVAVIASYILLALMLLAAALLVLTS